jgi:predicted PurR-regulated permease PerM
VADADFGGRIGYSKQSFDTTSGVAAAVVTAIIVGTLYFGREIFVPIALAILLSFVLAPLVRTLQRWHIPRGLSFISVVLLAFLSIFVLGGVIATQVTELAGDLPRYQFTMRERSSHFGARRQPAERSSAPPMCFRISARSSTSRRSPRLSRCRSRRRDRIPGH